MPDPFNTPDQTFVRENIPVFAVRRIVNITAGDIWTPDSTDIVFYSDTDTTYTLDSIPDSGSAYVGLSKYFTMGIFPGNIFTFSTNVTLAVMEK